MKGYTDIGGDGGSDVAAQIGAQRRAIDAALAGIGQRVAIASGKGGVGKSTVTIGLARALARRGHRVAVLDADLNGPTQAHMAGLEGAPWVPGESGLEAPRRADGLGVVSLGSVLAPGRPTELATISPHAEHTWRATKELALLGQLIVSVDWTPFDLLFIDLPPGAERTVHLADLLGEGARFVLVTIPSQVARGVVSRSVAAVEEAGGRLLGYVQNMAGYACPGCREVRPLFPEATAELALPRLGTIPFDPRLADLCDRGWPVGEELDGAAGRAFETTAVSVLRACGEDRS